MASEKRRSRKKHFTEEQIRKFQNDPNVRYVDDHTLRFKYEFKVLLYKAWEKEKRRGIIKVLIDNGFNPKELTSAFINTLYSNFRKYGHPTNSKDNKGLRDKTTYRCNPENNEYLINTGKFVKHGKGIAFSDDFKNELFASYPEQTIEDGIRKAGIDPKKVGYQRIYALKRLFERTQPVKPRSVKYSDEVIRKYKNHPYIKQITVKYLRFSRPFYNEASFLIEIMKVDEILNLYEIDPGDLSISVRLNLKYRLFNWKGTDDQCKETSPQLVRIQYRRYQKLTELVEERFRRIREIELPVMSLLEKKKLCYWIQGYPADPLNIDSISSLLRKIGISRSSYYSILRNEKYGVKQAMKEKQDEEDAELIRQVMAYRRYRKGSRQIYMIMPEVTARKFSLKKIRRLMKKFDIKSGIREKKQSRIEARKLLEERKKSNLLKRKFRIAGPNTHILTDVTYIPYGDNRMAYGSACLDAVTGRLYDFTISDCNDLNLVSAAAGRLEGVSLAKKAIFHSDQGSLYLTDTFQKKIKDLGLRQSMSKRGNCWDNAPQESFFGHFKDEADYRNCTSLVELQTLCADYMEYFNTERRQWTRNGMTPLEYEVYMEKMSPKEFAEYLKKEKKKYHEMKKRAAERAVEKAKTLGV